MYSYGTANRDLPFYTTSLLNLKRNANGVPQESVLGTLFFNILLLISYTLLTNFKEIYYYYYYYNWTDTRVSAVNAEGE